MKPRKRTNPFYVLLVIAGVAFVVTAFAYFMMTVRLQRQPLEGSENRGGGLVQVLSQHGGMILFVELAVLGVCTILAMVTDRWLPSHSGASGQARTEQKDP